MNRNLHGQITVLASAGVENDGANSNNSNNIFTIKDTKSYVPDVTLSMKKNQNLSKPLSKTLERSVYWNEHKTKSENKNLTYPYRDFLESNFVEVNILFVLIYSNTDDAKSLQLRYLIYQKVLTKIITILSMKKTFMTNSMFLIKTNMKK